MTPETEVAEEAVAEAEAVAEESVAEVEETAVDEETLLDDLLAETEEPAAEPAEEVAATDEAPEAVAEEAVAEVPAEEPAPEAEPEETVAEAEEPEVDEENLLDDLLAETEEPTAEPAEEVTTTDEVTEDVAEVEPEEPTAEPTEEVAEETVAEVEEPADEAVVDTPAEEIADADEATAEETVAEVEEPAADNASALIAGMTEETVDPKKIEEEQKFSDLALLMELKHRGLDNHAKACLQKARDLMDSRPVLGKAFEQYTNAIKMYEDAKQYFPQREENAKYRTECDEGILEARYRQAEVRFNEKNYDAALEMARDVQLSGHPKGEMLVKIIQDEMNKPEDVRPTPVLPEYAKAQYKKDRVAIQDRLRRATVYFQLSKYKEANDQLELILRDDPANEEAIDLRKRIERRHAERSRQLKYSTHNEMIHQVELSWTPTGALGRNSEELYAPTESKGATTKVNKEGEKDAAAVLAKLQYIRLPEFSIRPPSTLADAVTLFADMAKAYDKPELPPEEKGVAFVLNMSKAQAAPAESADEFSMEETSDSGLPPIAAISMPWVTLKDALDMVCEVTGSKYVIKGKTVMIVPASHVAGDMVTRSYNVVSGLVEKLANVKTEISTSSDGDDWSDSSSSTGNISNDTVKSAFTDLGVPFEGEAKIAYLASIGKLRVTNTAENLAILEGILEDLNVTPSQIEVETRFVEVSQTDLNSLGFEWTLNTDVIGTVGSGIDWANFSNNSYGGTAAGGNGVFKNNYYGGTGKSNVAMHGGQINQGMRFLGDSAASANRINLADSIVAPDDTFASFSAVFGKVDMTMILHMLAQRTDTDMLSSPKVLARPGQEALIRVVTEHIYPTEFDVTELEEAEQNYNGGNNGNGGDGLIGGQNINIQAPPVKFAVEPQSFETKDVGVSMIVIPEISDEGQMINMNVNPIVVEYLGDFDYGMKVPYIEYEFDLLGNVTGAKVKYYNVEMPQPKFHVREIRTTVSVYNGSTIVMGGLITETRKSFEDKVPLLGDLPFIGFLFRSKGEFSEKRNLLIFLTARLVDPAGRPLKTATDGRMGGATIDNVATETMGAAAE